ncbi:hypothetical protein MPER_10133 [Moniliophthora perniciosa FA553]|nr:hypothetical protein MPER_10133 [Moniliophthora perniciosa FA553]
MANKLTSLQPLTHDPAVAPTINTSPESLGYSETSVSDSIDSSPTASRVKRLSSAVEKLGRSLSGKAPSTSPPSGAGHRRLFSINRKGKGKAEDGLSASTPSISRPRSPMGSQPRKSQDDSPFITPPSPTLPASRPSLSAFRGGGSMRAGTQTLIQALQALPWTADPDNDDEVLDQGLPHISDEDGSEDEGQTKKPLASSIHTIHRPVARSMRMSTSGRSRTRANLPKLSPSSDDEGPSDIPQSDEDVEDIPDFEEGLRGR